MSSAAKPLVTLTKNQIDILCMAYLYGGVTSEHIKRRFFPRASQKSTLFDNLNKLTKAGYLRVKRLSPPNGIGSGKHFLMIDGKTRKIIAQALDTIPAELARASRTQAPTFIDHHLGICDFRLSLELSSNYVQWINLLGFLPEPGKAVQPIKIDDPRGDKITIHPDGYFILNTYAGVVHAYFEMDRGTIPARMRSRLRGYLLHGQTVLLVTIDQKRQQTLSEWISYEAKSLKRPSQIFYLTTQEKVSELTITDAPIWQVVGESQPRVLIPRPTTLTTASSVPTAGMTQELI